MNFWITTHYPHPTESHPWFLYMKRAFAHFAAGVTPGDHIAFYECCGERGAGRMGVVATSRIEQLRRRSRNAGNRVRNGEPEWTFEWPCEPPVFGVPVPRNQVLRTLRLGGLRIAGGLKRISESEFWELHWHLTRRGCDPLRAMHGGLAGRVRSSPDSAASPARF